MVMWGAVSFASHDANTIHACADVAIGNLRIVPDENSCLRTEQAVSWNAIGETGPQGPEGPAGPQGDTGPQGPSGISGYEIVTSNSVNNSATYKTHTLACPAGKRIIGGGAGVFGPVSTANAPHLSSSFFYPSTNTWYAEAEGGGGANWHIEVQVICAFVS